MRIVIMGDGKVGYTLAQKLSGEGHDIVMIDHSTDVLDRTANTLDVMTVSGNGVEYDVQLEAGVDRADILIAASASDEVNILCCLVARKVGAKHTIARVRNPAYTKQLSLMKEELGLSLAVNPGMQAASEISRILRYPPALHIEPFVRGRVELVETPVEKGNVLDGLVLKDLMARIRVHVLICAVERGDDVFIPKGEFQLHAGDRIFFMASAPDVELFFHAIGMPRVRIRNVMIVGGGVTAMKLAQQLNEMGTHVTIIEQNEARSQYLSEQLNGVTVICGDGTSQELLDEEGIASQDAFIALTGIDEENIVMAMYARANKVKKVVTKIERGNFMELFDHEEIGSVVSAKTLTVNRILHYIRSMENATASGVESLTRIVNDRVEALEFRVREDAEFLGVPILKLKIRKNLLIAAIVRAGRIIIPGAQDSFEYGDNIVVVTTDSRITDLRDIFA